MRKYSFLILLQSTDFELLFSYLIDCGSNLENFCVKINRNFSSLTSDCVIEHEILARRSEAPQTRKFRRAPATASAI